MTLQLRARQSQLAVFADVGLPWQESLEAYQALRVAVSDTQSRLSNSALASPFAFPLRSRSVTRSCSSESTAWGFSTVHTNPRNTQTYCHTSLLNITQSPFFTSAPRGLIPCQLVSSGRGVRPERCEPGTNNVGPGVWRHRTH